MLYFAYGSNLDCCQMRQRCPSAVFVGKGVLKNYRLALTHYSSRRKCGVADIVPDAGNEVWGVIYRIDSEEDIKELNKAEGYKLGRVNNAYQPIEIEVLQEVETTNSLKATAYEVVNKSKDEILTNQEYKKLIVDGAKFWDLPRQYVTEVLGSIQCA